MIDQHAGKDKWVKILWDAKTYLNERKWDGNTSYLLQEHIEKCRECYVDIENESEHVTKNLPNSRTEVQSLLNSIEGCTETDICTRVAVVPNQTNGMQSDFELAVSHLLPACDVASKVAKNQKNAHISGLGVKFKVGTGSKTDVELRHHNPPEFSQLSDAKRDDLFEAHPLKKDRGKKETQHNKGDRGGRKTSHGRKKPWEKKLKGQVVAAIKIQKEADKEEQKKETK